MEYSQVRELLEKLCTANGVTGIEDCAAKAAADELAKYMTVRCDKLGSVTGKKGTGKGILLDAHIDQIGLAVTAVKDGGFVKVAKVGGADSRVLVASEVIIHGKKDIYGVISSVPPHLAKGDENKKAPEFDDILIDTGYTKEELEKLVMPGDRITFKGSFISLAGSRVSSPSIDDRAGVVSILRCLQLLEGKNTLPLEVMFTVQEETGGSGAVAAAYNAESEEAIAVDVSFASAPDVSKDKYASLGDGALIGYAPALDWKISKKLTSLAKEKGIKASSEVMGGRTGTNGDDIQISRGGIKTALISIPIRNMHTPAEVADLADIEAVAQLMAEYIIERSSENA